MSSSLLKISDADLDEYLRIEALVAVNQIIGPIHQEAGREKIMARFHDKLFSLTGAEFVDLARRIVLWAKQHLANTPISTFYVLQDVLVLRPSVKYLKQHPSFIVDDERIPIEFNEPDERQLVDMLKSFESSLSPGERFKVDARIEMFTGN